MSGLPGFCLRHVEDKRRLVGCRDWAQQALEVLYFCLRGSGVLFSSLGMSRPWTNPKLSQSSKEGTLFAFWEERRHPSGHSLPWNLLCKKNANKTFVIYIGISKWRPRLLKVNISKKLTEEQARKDNWRNVCIQQMKQLYKNRLNRLNKSVQELDRKHTWKNIRKGRKDYIVTAERQSEAKNI